MTTINAKDYKSRQDLDDYVQNNIGSDIDANRVKDIQIAGTQQELTDKQLSPSTNVFGIKVVQN